MARKTNSHLFTPRHTQSFGPNGLQVATLVESRPYYPWGWGTWSGTTWPHQKSFAFRKRPQDGTTRPDGFRFPTSWGMVAQKADYTKFEYECRNIWNEYYEFRGDGPDSVHGFPRVPRVTLLDDDLTVAVSSNIVNRSHTQALNKIKNQHIDLGVALGEGKRTLTLLASLVSRLARSLSHAKKGNWHSAFQALGLSFNKAWKKDLANLWLEYQYGLKPLVSDIYGAQEQLLEGFKQKGMLFSASSEAKEALSPLEFWTTTPSTIEGPAFQLCKTVFWQEISRPWLYALSQLGLVNPASFAWELMRFSFVIDWLIPIGAFLSAFTASVGCDFVAGYQDRIVFADLKLSNTFYPITKGSPFRATTRMYAFQRIVLTGWGLPIPYVKNPFSTSHLTTAIALVTQLKR